MKIGNWTADFTEFRKKVESIFGPLEELAEHDPDIYAHQVLSHGFMKYAGTTDLHKKIAKEIAGSEDKFYKMMHGPKTEQQKKFDKQYDNKLKEEYMKWARENNLPEDLLEDGWQEYLED